MFQMIERQLLLVCVPGKLNFTVLDLSRLDKQTRFSVLHPKESAGGTVNAGNLALPSRPHTSMS